MNGRILTGDHRRLVLGVTAASILAMALTGCGGGAGAPGGASPPAAAAAASSAPAASAPPTAGSPGGAPDACQVVTADEASQLVGQHLKLVQDGGFICNYAAAGAVVTVTVRRLPYSDPAKARGDYNQAVAQFSHEPGTVLSHPGIGDQSLGGSISLAGIKMSAIAVLKGTVYLSIIARPGPGPAAMKSAATIALGRV